MVVLSSFRLRVDGGVVKVYLVTTPSVTKQPVDL